MTDNEIIKALERITLYSGFTDDVSNTLLDALELIKQQRENIERLQSMNRAKLDTIHDLQVEIEKLKEEVKDKERAYNDEFCLRKEWKNKCQELLQEKQTTKAEAYKEFAEKLEEKLCDCRTVSDGEYCGFDCGDTHECIDNLLKEMVGEKE